MATDAPRTPHFTEVPGAEPCRALNALDLPEPDESRTGVVACDRAAGHAGPHRIGTVVWHDPKEGTP